VSLHPIETAGDLLTVEVVVHDDAAVSAADFALTFEPDDGLPGQVFEYVGYDPGTYLAGTVGQLFGIDDRTPGRVQVSAARIPAVDRAGAGPEALLSVVLRARRTGTARLGFDAFGAGVPALLDTTGLPVPGLAFPDGPDLTVDASAGGPPGQRIGFAPAVVDFGEVAPGATARRRLRLSNFGFSELRLDGATPSLGSIFAAYLTPPATIESFGFVEITLDFLPTQAGIVSADLTVLSNDPETPTLRVPLVGRSAPAVGLSATRLDFGTVDIGAAKTLTLVVTNRSGGTLDVADLTTSDARFDAQAGFATLAAGQSGDVDVRFRPDTPGDIRGDVTLTLSGTADQTLRLRAAGSGR
jgi:hypothetical protein